MAKEPRKWAQGARYPESYETATPVAPLRDRVARGRPASAAQQAMEFVKLIEADATEGFKLLEDKGSGVILFKFDQAPHPDIQRLMEDKGFHWALVKAAWAQPISQVGRSAAREVIEDVRKDQTARAVGR